MPLLEIGKTERTVVVNGVVVYQVLWHESMDMTTFLVPQPLSMPNNHILLPVTIVNNHILLPVTIVNNHILLPVTIVNNHILLPVTIVMSTFVSISIDANRTQCG